MKPLRHLLAIQESDAESLRALVSEGARWKRLRADGAAAPRPLHGQIWGLIFAKSSTRTRVSFEVGLRELGADSLFLSSSQLQLGRGEPIADTARVLGRMLDGAVIRTYAQADVEEFAAMGGIPTINALTDAEHPCQIIADLLTINELRGSDWGAVRGMTLAFLGDGACNMAASWAWAAQRLGFRLRIGAPRAFWLPDRERWDAVEWTEDPAAAVRGADFIYTDVWASMGQEQEAAPRRAALAPYQVNAELMRAAAPGAAALHCLPAHRGEEISAEVMEEHAETIFTQAENRLHAQKAVLRALGAPGATS